MTSLVVLAFKKLEGAEEARDKLYELQKKQLITIEDAAVVRRLENGKVKVKQAHSLVGAGALGGAFWGMLIGVLFWMPWLGLAVGAASGALSGKFADIGVDDEFIEEVSETIEPGHSALFLMSRDAQIERLKEEMSEFEFEIIQSNLSPSDEENLKELFAAPEVAG
jgi:uncharacterized membrane protein